jgi:hypothetical protein
MAWFKKKPDPISERARALNEQIAALEAQIKHLTERPDEPSTPRLRSTALPHGQTLAHPSGAHAAVDPVFEEVEQDPFKSQPETTAPGPSHELGVKRNDLRAGWRRFKSHFRGPATSNPKLVNYLAAGSIQGLRPLRYEKRVMRNRFILLVALLVLVLWGIAWIVISR